MVGQGTVWQPKANDAILFTTSKVDALGDGVVIVTLTDRFTVLRRPVVEALRKAVAQHLQGRTPDSLDRSTLPRAFLPIDLVDFTREDCVIDGGWSQWYPTAEGTVHLRYSPGDPAGPNVTLALRDHASRPLLQGEFAVTGTGAGRPDRTGCHGAAVRVGEMFPA